MEGRLLAVLVTVVVLILVTMPILGCAPGQAPTLVAPTAADSAAQAPSAPEAGALATTAPLQVADLPTPVLVPSPSPTPTPLPIEHRTMVFSGDVLSHLPVIGAANGFGQSSGWAYDYRPMFAHIEPRISAADLAICVLETPVSADNTALAGYPTFNAPRELVDALIQSGYDGCSTASNHSMDRGKAGVGTTLDQMQRVGLGQAGMARSEAEWAEPTIYDMDGVRVAHLSYTYSLNGFVLPDDEPWLVNLNDVDAILAEADRARAIGADAVVLSIQWGNEYQRAPSDEQLDLAHRLTAPGKLDLIIGNHVHVVQPVDWVNDTPVVYGIGNSLSNQSTERRIGTQDGVIVQATLSGNTDVGWAVSELAFAPTWVDRSTYTIIDLIEVRRSQPDHVNRVLWDDAFDRTVEAISSLGVELPLAE